MRLPPPNFLDTEPIATIERPRRPLSARRVFRRALKIVRTTIIVMAVVFAVLTWTTRTSNPNILLALRDSTAVRSVLTILRSSDAALIGEREGRINVLLLGMGGVQHEGPFLTDTIILASIQPSTRRVALISIPRDLAIPLPDGQIQKANAVYAYAETSKRGGATIRAALTQILGVTIPYHIRIDFSGFVGLIDELGGVDVDVERTIDDPEYPVEGRENAPWPERFERLVIPAGLQHIDGTLALKYVRSRHTPGLEGSDFARAQRQQKLLLAIRNRILSTSLITNPKRAIALLEAWHSHIDTNLNLPELYAFSSFATAITSSEVMRLTFSDAPNGELTAGRLAGAYVLQPRDGTFGQMQELVRSVFNQPAGRQYAAAPSPPGLSIEVWNGTGVNGLAARTAEILEQEGLNITAIRNAPVRDLEQSMIYHRPEIPEELVTRLRDLLKAQDSTAFPVIVTEPRPDILVILGASSISQFVSYQP